MKIIDLSSLVAGTKEFPIAGNVNGVSLGGGGSPTAMQGLDFLQVAVKEMSAALANALMTSAQSAGTTPVILWGCTLTRRLISPFEVISPGAVYVPSGTPGYGEVFLVTTAQTISGTPLANIGCNWIANPTDIGGFKTELSDGSLVSIHNQRTLTFAYSATVNSGNIIDYGTWQNSQIPQIANNTTAITTLNTEVATLLPLLTTPTLNAISSPGTGFTVDANSYYAAAANGLVVVNGIFHIGTYSQSTVCTLPLAAQPSNIIVGVWQSVTIPYPGGTTLERGSFTLFSNGVLEVVGMSTASNGGVLVFNVTYYT